jgi:CheY-like chemotaxis protein
MPQVLVVDDDAELRDATGMLLAAAGYQVVEAADGRPALTHLQRSTQGMIVLLDLDMPGMDGEAVLAAVEASPQLARRHVFILFTAHQGHTLSLRLAQLLTTLAVPTWGSPSRWRSCWASSRRQRTVWRRAVASG